MSLEQKLKAVIEQANLDAGVAVTHIESGEQIEINGRALFPMASVFKIPILAAAAQQIAQGKFSLDDRVTLRDEDKSTGSGILAFFQAGLQPTRRDLLTLMIIISDNTATDINVELLGGAQVVESAMHSLGLTDIFFKMNCKDLLKHLVPRELWDRSVEEISVWWDSHDIVRDGVVLSRTPENNVSSAASMNRLVTMLYQGDIVQGEAQDAVMKILYQQQLNQRLPRFLPSNVPFAHKTGTIAGFCNDSGMMTLPDNTHAVVTAFTSWDDQPFWQNPEGRMQRVFEVESAIGKIGQLVYQHYSGQAT